MKCCRRAPLLASPPCSSRLLIHQYISMNNSVTTAETPSVRQIQGYIRDKQAIAVKLITGDTLQGSIFWQDQDCLCLRVGEDVLTIWKQAIAYIQPQP